MGSKEEERLEELLVRCDQETLKKVHLKDKEGKKARVCEGRERTACLSDYMDKWGERERPAMLL